MAATVQSPEHRLLGRAVRRCRHYIELSQEGLGFASGLHRNYIGAIERGEINPTFRVLLKLGEGLRIPLSHLIAEYEDLRDAESDTPSPTARAALEKYVRDRRVRDDKRGGRS